MKVPKITTGRAKRLARASLPAKLPASPSARNTPRLSLSGMLYTILQLRSGKKDLAGELGISPASLTACLKGSQPRDVGLYGRVKRRYQLDLRKIRRLNAKGEYKVSIFGIVQAPSPEVEYKGYEPLAYRRVLQYMNYPVGYDKQGNLIYSEKISTISRYEIEDIYDVEVIAGLIIDAASHQMSMGYVFKSRELKWGSDKSPGAERTRYQQTQQIQPGAVLDDLKAAIQSYNAELVRGTASDYLLKLAFARGLHRLGQFGELYAITIYDREASVRTEQFAKKKQIINVKKELKRYKE